MRSSPGLKPRSGLPSVRTGSGQPHKWAAIPTLPTAVVPDDAGAVSAARLRVNRRKGRVLGADAPLPRVPLRPREQHCLGPHCSHWMFIAGEYAHFMYTNVHRMYIHSIVYCSSNILANIFLHFCKIYFLSSDHLNVVSAAVEETMQKSAEMASVWHCKRDALPYPHM